MISAMLLQQTNCSIQLFQLEADNRAQNNYMIVFDGYFQIVYF